MIDSGIVIADILEEPTMNIEEVRWEAHKKFNDVQYIIRGKAKMGVVSPSVQGAIATSPYEQGNDIMHFKNESGQYYDADPKSFFIFLPEEMHRPSIRISGDDVVKK